MKPETEPETKPGTGTNPGELPTLRDCVHCGMCLPECPTYHVTGREVQNPRGRIAALRTFAETGVALTPAVTRGLADCLVCRACESVCPSGISMERIMSGHRQRTGTGMLEQALLEGVITRPLMRSAASQLARVVRPLLRALSLPMSRPVNLPIDLPSAARLASPPPLIAPPPRPPLRGTVALFRGCIADRWFRAETLAAARVLAHVGWQVRFPPSTCCGALHRHAGRLAGARALERESVAALTALAPDHVVVDAAGCAAALAEPLAGDALASRITTTAALLADSDRDLPRIAGHWAVAVPCHERHGPLGDGAQRALLERVLVDGYRELPGPDHCCGAAGLFMVRRPRLSRMIGASAHARFLASGASGVLSGNPGCLLRWESLLEDQRVPEGGVPERGAPEGSAYQALHPVVLLDRAIREEQVKHAP